MKTARLTYKEWISELSERYENKDDTEFVCPACGYHQTLKQCRDAGMSDGMIGFSCIGRVIEGSQDAFRANKKGPCNYAGGGLFKLNPVLVIYPENDKEIEVGVFDVAERPFCDDPRFAIPESKKVG
jgi:hypothetical protein